MQKMQIEYWPIDWFIPYENNPRKNDHVVDKFVKIIKEHGFRIPILAKSDGSVIDGHFRLKAAKKAGLKEVPVTPADDMTESQIRAFRISVNAMAELAEWDNDLLKIELEELGALNIDLDSTGLDEKFINGLFTYDNKTKGLTDPNVIPEPPSEPVTQKGDLLILGRHRLLCGDSIIDSDVHYLMDGDIADLVHADPPYGMGKEIDGVLNDNIYKEKLDKFQMNWWTAFRPFLSDRGSAYIWGNAEDLWRLWFIGGLSSSKYRGEFDYLELRNQIIWDKKNIPGMNSDLITQYPVASEHCLFLQVGKQFIGNVNSEDYWEGWDEIRLYLKEEADAIGLTPKKTREICGCQMYSHWFTKSQWSLISEKNYKLLQAAFPGNFEKDYHEIKRKYNEIKGGFRNHINGILGGMRSYFDNVHDIMRDVWEFPRVFGKERQGYATPKPVEMIARAIKSSLPEEAIVAEPFIGTGTSLIAAEMTNRICYGMELSPKWCDVTIKRWEEYTGKKAIRIKV